jgi:uncharacterized membrane protein YbhN (UPF0104 family)
MSLRGDEMSAADSSEEVRGAADSSVSARDLAEREEPIAAADRRYLVDDGEEDGEKTSAPDRVASDGGSDDEQMPRVPVTRRSAIAFGVFVLSAVAFLYFVLPKLAGFSSTAHRIETGDTWWIAIGVLLEICSFAGYVVLFRAVFVRDPSPIGWSESYQITMAGLAATRLFAAAGAGGIALTAWALRRSGMGARLVACRMVAFMVLLYVVYAGAVLLDGIGMGTGLLPGEGSFALTIVPAVIAALLFALAGAMALLPGDIERRLARWAAGSGRLGHWLASAATVPALAASGVRTAIELVRERDPGLLGAPAWWGFDICVLWACFHAFGSAPPFTVILMAYFLGMVGNLLPLPGGLGGVEGGMIGAFAAFGVNLDQAVLAVLAYRAISFWLPTLPGAIAYFQLRRTVARWRSEQAAPKSATAKPIETAGPLHV